MIGTRLASGGFDCEFGARGDSQLRVDVLEMGLDGIARDEHLCGDLRVREPGRDQTHCLPFGGCQALPSRYRPASYVAAAAAHAQASQGCERPRDVMSRTGGFEQLECLIEERHGIRHGPAGCHRHAGVFARERPIHRPRPLAQEFHSAQQRVGVGLQKASAAERCCFGRGDTFGSGPGTVPAPGSACRANRGEQQREHDDARDQYRGTTRPFRCVHPRPLLQPSPLSRSPRCAQTLHQLCPNSARRRIRDRLSGRSGLTLIRSSPPARIPDAIGGEQNGFEANTAHVQYWMDVQGGVMSSPNPIQPERRPAWTLTAPSWPIHTTPYELTLGANGVLGDAASGALSYGYPATSSSLVWPEYAAEWQVPPAPAGSLAYTTNALASDVVAAGPASLNIWLSSTATDTDVQATITEVRPDGKELYVQRGWLRASERALDEQRSTATRPYHVHEASAREELTPGRPELLRVEIMPFAHAFRAGSKIRVYVDAPSGVTGNWNFSLNVAPAVNTVHFDGSKRSALVMSVVPGAVAQAPLPPCDSLASQPCRPDPFALQPSRGGAS